MIFDWKGYLDLARSLQRIGDRGGQCSEAAYRSAASRAYYAAFHHAMGYAQERLGFKPTHAAQDHGEVLTRIDRPPTFVQARHLSQLLEWRRLCDYADEVENLPRIAREAVAYADKVMDKLR